MALQQGDRELAQTQVDECIAKFAIGEKRNQCLESLGYPVFDDTGIETAGMCIPFCICGVQGTGDCPCCETGPWGGWIYGPSLDPAVETPKEPFSERVSLEFDQACVGDADKGTAEINISARSESRLAPLIDLSVSIPRAGIVAANVSDQGKLYDDRVGDGVYSGRALIADESLEGKCLEFPCWFECDGEWVYPEEGEGHCPANDWWGIGCLKLTNCGFGCGGSDAPIDPTLTPADNFFTLQPSANGASPR